MKIARIVTTVILLLFVGATVGVLIAQEVSHPPVLKQGAVPETVVNSAEEATSPASGVQAPTSSIEVLADVSTPDNEIVDEDTPSAQLEVDENVNSAETIAPITDGESKEACVVDAIYFHNTQRCYTCRKIEETAKTVMEAEFSDEFASGRLRWSVINMEEERQYIGQYDLAMPTLILARSNGNVAQDWIALDDTWRLIGSEMRFSMYIADRTRTFLGGCP